MSAPFPAPVPTSLSAPYWSALADGRLTFQQCRCGHRWLPARAECPSCLGADWEWTDATGRGRIVSWVVYHVAYHPAFADTLPYNVAVIELDEGVRLVSNVLDCPDGSGLAGGLPVALVVTREHGCALAKFRVAAPAAPAHG
jgi:uncharacterized OB-fold protein